MRDVDASTVSALDTGHFRSVPSLRLLTSFCIFAALFSSYTDAVVITRPSQADSSFSDESVNLKEVASGGQLNLPAKPVFLESLHGVERVNYDLDDRGLPFIVCEYYDVSACDPAETACATTKMCYASAQDHRLGCMAALVNNSSSRQITLKGCWMHDGNLGKCDHSRCEADERPTGHGNAALFCCCNTHRCNRDVFFTPPSKTLPPSTSAPVEVVDPGLFSSDSWIAIIIVLGIFIACLLILVSYWTYREIRRNRHIKAKGADVCSLPILGEPPNNPLIEPLKKEGFRNISDLQPIARGRYGQVFRGMLDGEPIAVKVFPAADVSSWVLEQDIYALSALRNHENILRFIGAEVHGNDYWLMTEYHESGSLFDYILVHTLTLRDALKVISTMLRGLSFLHEEKTIDGEFKPCVVHRDFKSKNVLLRDDLTCVIADFGLAIKCENDHVPVEDNRGQVGTRRYMSPEVLEGATEFSAFAFCQIDVYAAGIVLWEVLSRTAVSDEDEPPPYRQPFEAEAGLQPSVHELRSIVVTQKVRPKIRDDVLSNNIGGVLWKTVEDMWNADPDGRITSGCAYERANTLYLSYGVESRCPPFLPPFLPSSSLHEGASHSHSTAHSGDDTQPALMIKDGSLGSNGFNAATEEYGNACMPPPNICMSTTPSGDIQFVKVRGGGVGRRADRHDEMGSSEENSLAFPAGPHPAPFVRFSKRSDESSLTR